MTYSDFANEVKKFLPADANATNLQDFINKYILHGVIDLQRMIPYYKTNAATTYTHLNTTVEGKACRGSKSTSARIMYIKAYEIVDDEVDTCKFKVANYLPWSDRGELVCGRVTDCDALHVSFNPKGTDIIFYPAITDKFIVEVQYDGVATSFGVEDTVLDTQAAIVIAKRVIAELALYVDRDAQAYSLFNQQYLNEVAKLKVEKQELRG